MSGLSSESFEALMIERRNFNNKVNTLRIYATLLLEEIQYFSNQVF